MNRLVQKAIGDAIPIILAYFTIAVTFGVISTSNGIPVFATVLISVLVYAGSSQFMLVSLVLAGSSPLSTIVTVLLVNLRHFLYGTNLGLAFAPWSEWKKWFFAFGLTDEVFAVTSSRIVDYPPIPGYQIPFVLACYTSWILGTIVGAGIGQSVPVYISSVLDFSLPALFLALLFGGKRTIPHLVAAVCGALFAVFATWLHLGSIGVVVGGFSGATLGFWLHKRIEVNTTKSKIQLFPRGL